LIEKPSPRTISRAFFMSGRPTAATVREWEAELDAVGERIAGHFPRAEPRDLASGYLRLLLSDVERKNG
jgi:hypothetical protein